MRDDDDLHEPEHDHLLDHEFHQDEDSEPDACSFADALDDDEEALAGELDGMDHPAWHDDVE